MVEKKPNSLESIDKHILEQFLFLPSAMPICQVATCFLCVLGNLAVLFLRMQNEHGKNLQHLNVPSKAGDYSCKRIFKVLYLSHIENLRCLMLHLGLYENDLKVAEILEQMQKNLRV